MPDKQTRLLPATRDKVCKICGTAYRYPEKGSAATRFHCEACAALPAAFRKVLNRMSMRIDALERKSNP
jgi:predicted nucleic acid-binding Zn ribbon protein